MNFRSVLHFIFMCSELSVKVHFCKRSLFTSDSDLTLLRAGSLIDWYSASGLWAGSRWCTRTPTWPRRSSDSCSTTSSTTGHPPHFWLIKVSLFQGIASRNFLYRIFHEKATPSCLENSYLFWPGRANIITKCNSQVSTKEYLKVWKKTLRYD